ncbi:DUF3575 domain-containing protein [Dyadobacter sp. NIV53]|uniref:DUF3575 domain-containing protein n=1 Tax=Dyadobacter sp. NIV53 TaxID=2861765 RepID=UPI001C889194|nr:DUF3575 domain-containing protein [Dyadobacter sp. NIV53]
MNCRISLLFIFLLVFHFSHAQIDPDESKNHIILKWSPLSLFDIDNTVQLGLEVPVNDKFTIQQDIGYGHSGFNVWYADYENRPDIGTIKSRTQLRYYFYAKPRFRSYLAGEYLFKRVVRQETKWVGMDCVDNGGCSYFSYKNVKQGKFVNALHAKIGWQFYFSNRTSLDLFVGFGLRKARIRTLTKGVGNVDFDNGWDWWINANNNDPQIIPSVSTGFHLGFALGRFKKKED